MVKQFRVRLLLKTNKMKNLKICLTLIVVFCLSSCVSKKKFDALEKKVNMLEEIGTLTIYDDDDDQDGIINVLDRQPDSKPGCPVDVKGIELDSDGDGIIDCHDKEPYSPPGYEVDEEGVVVVPAMYEDVVVVEEPAYYYVGEETKVTNEFTLVDTYFATDRNLIGEADHPQLEFGTYRDKVKYGKCVISIPASHQVGQIETPSWWRLEFREDPGKHVMYQKSEIFDKDGFFEEIQSIEGKKMLLFVHGYNVSFVNAAKRTAQMAYDLSFPGVPLFYSWPSQASLSGYIVDSQNIEYAEPNIKQFIIDLIVQMPDHEIYIVAHSMGNRGVTKALVSIFKENPEHAARIKEIILTAPDIDAQIFKRDIAPNLIMHGNSVTLYSSSTDKALEASKAINGYQRAGDAGGNIVIIDGIETIDATNISTGFLGHSYFGETRSVLNDIDLLIDNGLKANERNGLEKEVSKTGTYWKFKQ